MEMEKVGRKKVGGAEYIEKSAKWGQFAITRAIRAAIL